MVLVVGTKNIQIKINYDEEKMKAIRMSLLEKSKDFDDEILKFIDTLYQKNVPKVLKKYIEAGVEKEKNTAENTEKSE